jgi:CRP-like cAMP-binding protein
MNTFLNKLAQIPSIQEVLLLSPRGDLLFYKNNNETAGDDSNLSLWNEIIKGLNPPVQAEFYFDKGVYSLHHTEVGYVIVGMKGNGSLQKIKNACAILQAKLSDRTICKKVLLKMLREADEKLKPHFVMVLIPFADDEIAEKLAVLLDNEAELNPETKTELLVNACQVLGQSASVTARLALKKILQKHYSGQITLENQVRYTAQVALAQLELDLPDKINNVRPQLDKLPGNVPPAAQPETSARVLPEKQRTAAVLPEARKIQELLDSSRKGEAVALLLEQIEICACKKQFEPAEKLRNWLIQIDSTLLNEIIRAAEIIEEEKNASIGDELSSVWNKLIQTLSIEEFSSLYNVMVHKHYNNGELVARQGEFLSILFFVDSGQVQLYSAGRGKEHVLKVVKAGEILGAENFFDISIWTMSARSLGADLSLLTWDRLWKLKENNPALMTKLMDFCSRFKLTDTVFSKLGSTRRVSDRVKVPGKVAIALQKQPGNESYLGAKGDLLDISRGGLAFSLRFSKKKNAIALLGQGLRVIVRTDASPFSVDRNGVVKAVLCHDFVGNDYTIHMEFGEELSNAEVRQVIGLKQ